MREAQTREESANPQGKRKPGTICSPLDQPTTSLSSHPPSHPSGFSSSGWRTPAKGGGGGQGRKSSCSLPLLLAHWMLGS